MDKVHAIEILPNLWLGTVHIALDRRFIEQHKITCVVNCTVKYPFIDNSSIKKIRIPVRDTGKDPEFYKMYLALSVATDKIYDLLRTERILIHCYAGKQRSVTLVLGFLMKYCKYTVREAIRALRRKWPYIGMNFSKSLVMYGDDLVQDGVGEAGAGGSGVSLHTLNLSL